MRSIQDPLSQAMNSYVNLLKSQEELTQTELALVRESFREGWIAAAERFDKEFTRHG